MRAFSRLVTVPVVVTQKGKPVTGLTLSDFTVEQDQKRVTLAGLEVIGDTRAKGMSLEAAMTAMPSAVPDTADHTYNALAVIVLDILNTQEFFQGEGQRAVLEFMETGLDRRRPTALVVLTRRGLKLISDFSTSPADLQVAARMIRREKGGKHMPREVEGNTNGPDTAFDGAADPVELPSNVAGAYLMKKVLEGLIADMHAEERVARYEAAENARITFRAFSTLASALAKLPGRKSLVWFSGSLPFPLEYRRYPTNEIGDIYARVMNEFSNASVSVYPIHLRGLENVAPENDVTIDRYQRGAGLNTSAWFDRSTTRIDTARDIAYRTGGIAFVNTNDFGRALRQALDDGESYYMLTYYVSAEQAKPGWHTLSVKVQGRDAVEVRAKRGFMIEASQPVP